MLGSRCNREERRLFDRQDAVKAQARRAAEDQDIAVGKHVAGAGIATLKATELKDGVESQRHRDDGGRKSRSSRS